MLNVSRPLCVRSLLLCLLATLAGPTAQAQTQSTALNRQLERLDLSVSGIGVFNRPSTGTVTVNAQPTPLTITPGNTLGALITLRYIVKPWIGFEGNFSYARYTEKFSTIGGVQQNAREYTLGYVAHTPPVLGIRPFVSIGAGSTAFRPTPGGGLGLLEQARATYYYSVGAEKDVSSHFGLRAQFRESFFLAPDYGQNYLTILKHTTTFEPGVGFFLRF
jgi:hypothetical protein